jgi:GH15 family glucan-1,4-alpha-glucosidase
MRQARDSKYLPLRDYAIIGDAHTAALVARDGSIDWCCWPHFDSPAVFCRLLDAHRGGYFRIGPTASNYSSSRSYRTLTNVLQTKFETDGGTVLLTDLMPIERLQNKGGEDVAPSHEILRLVEGLDGMVEIEIAFRPTFDYARGHTTVSLCEEGAVANAKSQSLALYCPVPLHRDLNGVLVGRLRLPAGKHLWLSLTYQVNARREDLRPQIGDAHARLERTLTYWKQWCETSTYEGPYSDLVHRSALVLKLLTFEPTGALVAAPTTSLPEEVGGIRNWDYRFTWLRDSALIIYALQLIGYRQEATDFFNWLDRLCVGYHGDMQIMYTVRGESDLSEYTLEHLTGYRGSYPVRIGNSAYKQRQLDVYGEVLDAVHLYHEQMHQSVKEDWWDEVCFMADQAAARWRDPDHGIWEVRGGKRHFLYSKLMCWVALDRALKLGAQSGYRGATARWAKARNEIRSAILAEGYNTQIGAFTQVFGGTALDASALVIPFSGFLSADDSRVSSTVSAISEQLTSHGMIYRYLTEDGLPGREGAFAMCTFWLADNFALAGRVDEAREIFERVVSYANDTGLLSEEIDPVSGELLGNYPQGFTHLALIRTALHIAKAETLGAEHRAADSAERASEIEGSGIRSPR